MRILKPALLFRLDSPSEIKSLRAYPVVIVRHFAGRASAAQTTATVLRAMFVSVCVTPSVVVNAGLTPRNGTTNRSITCGTQRSSITKATKRRVGFSQVVRAGPDDDRQLSPIEQREQQVKGRKGKAKEGYFDSYPTKQGDDPLGLWETDPEAWNAKPGLEKLWSTWSGEPGMMFWMNKGSYAGAGGLAFVWVLFRLVGPALGLYKLN